jgi:uncharacterized protein
VSICSFCLSLLVAAFAPLAAARSGALREITRDEPVPRDWDARKQFRETNPCVLAVADPRARQMLKRMREVRGSAPTNDAMDDQRVRLPGYLVALEESKAGPTESLPVPHFGACLHMPPAPSNQIVHARAARPGALRARETIRASATLHALRPDSYMGASSRRLDGAAVRPYVEMPAGTPRMQPAASAGRRGVAGVADAPRLDVEPLLVRLAHRERLARQRP